MRKKILLMVLDGWGIAVNKKNSAIHQANTPFIDTLKRIYPHSMLHASGSAVGLPDGQMGNSEVGHMNIGGGRVVLQNLVHINNAIADGTLERHSMLLDAFSQAKEKGRAIHFIGLVSNGRIHAHIDHLKALISIAHQQGVSRLFVHAFTDGRDAAPKSGFGFLEALQQHMDNTTGKLATVVGRYFAMDRDNRWERTKVAYDALVSGIGKKVSHWQEGVRCSYEEGVSDEFIRPIVVTDHQGDAVGSIEEGDTVLFFNFRPDRARQLTRVLTQHDFPEWRMHTLMLNYITMTCYDDTFKKIDVLFHKNHLVNTLGEVIAKADKKQIRIAETEKYPHVTFFFSGGRENLFDGEARILCPSPKVATYDLAPEMSAGMIRDKIIPELQRKEADFICLNFANPDMVGHTGVFEAAVKACEVVDLCNQAVTEAALQNGYTVLLIADHGNADIMRHADQSPHTAHTTNLVPCILVDKEYKGILRDGKLGDVAPTILTLMGIPIPKEMDGSVLIDI